MDSKLGLLISIALATFPQTFGILAHHPYSQIVHSHTDRMERVPWFFFKEWEGGNVRGGMRGKRCQRTVILLKRFWTHFTFPCPDLILHPNYTATVPGIDPLQPLLHSFFVLEFPFSHPCLPKTYSSFQVHFMNYTPSISSVTEWRKLFPLKYNICLKESLKWLYDTSVSDKM